MVAVKLHEKQLIAEIALIPGVSEVRGAGLLIAIELTSPISNNVLVALRDNGVLVNAPTPTTIRIAPALTVTTVQINRFITVLRKVMANVD
jgi:acetylornithine aminotransferase